MLSKYHLKSSAAHWSQIALPILCVFINYQRGTSISGISSILYVSWIKSEPSFAHENLYTAEGLNDREGYLEYANVYHRIVAFTHAQWIYGKEIMSKITTKSIPLYHIITLRDFNKYIVTFHLKSENVKTWRKMFKFSLFSIEYWWKITMFLLKTFREARWDQGITVM